MDEHAHHDDLIEALQGQLRPILESSEQAIYAYLDDEHKFCNAKFADLLDYASPEEWAKASGSFPELFVDEKSRSVLISAYRQAMEKKAGSSCHIIWKKKAGGTVESTVILVPITHKGHLFALHFVTA